MWELDDFCRLLLGLERAMFSLTMRLVDCWVIQLRVRRGDLSASRAALTEAIDLFERLAMRRSLAEARAA
jgi:hypothetical protein